MEVVIHFSEISIMSDLMCFNPLFKPTQDNAFYLCRYLFVIHGLFDVMNHTVYKRVLAIT